jgi:hypothetical protein
MENRAAVQAPPAILLGLAEYLQLTGSKLSVEQAMTLAISEWQASHRRQALTAPATQQLHGYQWKALFLPDSTQLRMLYGGDSYYAHVIGDYLIYQGRRVSPREFTMSVSRSVRNAWRELCIRFPGERSWKRAQACRTEQEKNDRQLPMSPIESMTAAAACMSEALKTALRLVEDTSLVSARQIERRLGSHRRDDDRLHTDCAFDT